MSFSGQKRLISDWRMYAARLWGPVDGLLIKKPIPWKR